MRLVFAVLTFGLLGGCNDPEPLGPDATPEQLGIACEAMDLDACSRAAHLRSAQYDDTFIINQ